MMAAAARSSWAAQSSAPAEATEPIVDEAVNPLRSTEVDEYIAAQAADRVEVLTQLRELFLKVLDGYEEQVAYGGPCYSRDGKIELGFGNQKRFVGVYILKKEVVDAFRDRLRDAGKGAVRFKPEAVDLDLVREMLEATVASADVAC